MFDLERKIRFALLAALAIFVAGCGGGSSTTTFRYTTDWTNKDRAGAITGLSQKISLLSLSGTTLATQVINQDVPGKQSISIPSIPSGTVHVLVQLNSASNFTGAITGTVEEEINLTGGSTVQTSVGDEIASIRVTPSPKTVIVEQTAQFYAHAENTTGIATFSRAGDYQWSVLGGIGNVGTSGLVTTAAAGSGTVRATHTPTDFLGSASLFVQANSKARSKWTLLVYMNAANDLDQFSTPNMNQMEQAAGNPDVRIVVQWKQVQNSVFSPNPSFVGTRRYLVRPGTTNAIESQLVQDMGTNIDMGNAQTLSDFINWGKTNYPADRYMLVIWNHGNGWRRSRVPEYPTRGVSYDDDTGNSIGTSQLPQALASGNFDIVAWDASLMQMMEVAYEIKAQAKYVIGSEESPPGAGYPYDTIFGNFRDHPDDTTASLSKAFVDDTLAVPGYVNQKITQSVVDTSKLDILATAIDNLGLALIANAPSLTTIAPAVRANTQSYKDDGFRFYRDIVDLCTNLEASSPPQAVITASAATRTALAGAIVWEGHNANSPRSHGLSIDFSPSASFVGTVADDYAQLSIATTTSWDNWLKIAP